MLEWRAQRRCALLTSLPVFLVCLAVTSLPAHADTKVLTAEATYTMGEGETMTFAEAMVLQKAKQIALEQAGTYVESYSKVQNYQLTADEIQTIAGGVLQVEVLEKTRTLVGDGLKFFVKIKATVTTDKVAELAGRIKGKNIAEEYKKLQEDYSKLNQDIERWKQLVAKTPAGPERDAALDQIREREKAFSVFQKNEAAFFQRLVSGEALFSKALDQLSRKQNEKAVVDHWFEKALDQGFVITIGEPDIQVALENRKSVDLSVPVTVKATEVLMASLLETARSLRGTSLEGFQTDDFRSPEPPRRALITRIAEDLEIVRHLQNRVANTVFVLELILDDERVRACYVAPSFLNRVSLPLVPVSYVSSYEETKGRIVGIFRDLGRSDFQDKRMDSENGFVAVFVEPIVFTPVTALTLEEAKRVKAVRGRVVEGTLPRTEPCKIQK